MRILTPSRALLASSLVLLGCAGDGGTASTTPASVAAVSSTAVTATVANVVTPSPQFIVRDAAGKAIDGASVSIAVGTGGGTLTGAPSKSSAGGTSVGTWTLGNTSGTNTLIITVNGLSAPLTISATGTADVPTQLTVSNGNNQSALAGAALAQAVIFKVGDKFNNGIPNISVSFAVTSGGGALPGGSATVVTDANGAAIAPAWTLGKNTGTQTLRGSAVIGTSSTLTGQAAATVASDFTIEVRFHGPTMDPAAQAAFTTAANRIQGMVTGDLAAQAVNPLQSDWDACGLSSVPKINETVDDLIVYATVATLSPGILGSAGPCFIRPAGGAAAGFPVIGVMQFSTTFIQTLIADGRLADVITHEMLHTVGIGTLWASKGQVSGSGTAGAAFIGQQAVAACLFHGGTLPLQCGGGTVPVETLGGSGTAFVHWRENTSATGIGLDRELMTGTAEPSGIPMPLSRISIGSLGDLGYTVNLLAADSYTFPSTAMAALAAIREAQGMGDLTLNEDLREPLAYLDATGRSIRIRKPQ